MNAVWYVLRVFYALGLLPVVVLFAFGVLGFARDPEVASALVVGGSAYFVFGYLIFSVIPHRFRNRLQKLVAGLRPEFHADYAVYSLLLNSYLGIDRKGGEVMYVDLARGIEAVFAVPEIRSWEVEDGGRAAASLRLSTTSAELPLLGLRIHRRESCSLATSLQATFG